MLKRVVLAAAGVLLLSVTSARPFAFLRAETADERQVAECRVQNDAAARIYALVATGTGDAARWTLTFQSGATAGRRVRLALPGARPVIAPGSVRLHYRSANGGRLIDLTVRPGGSALEVWVDHGLEVNVEPDLDPAVDAMSTDGVMTSLACTVASTAGARPR